MFDFGTFDVLTFDQGDDTSVPPPVVVPRISQLALMGVGCWLLIAVAVVLRSVA